MRGSGLLEEVRTSQVSGGGGHALILDFLLFLLPKKWTRKEIFNFQEGVGRSRKIFTPDA